MLFGPASMTSDENILVKMGDFDRTANSLPEYIVSVDDTMTVPLGKLTYTATGVVLDNTLALPATTTAGARVVFDATYDGFTLDEVAAGT